MPAFSAFMEWSVIRSIRSSTLFARRDGKLRWVHCRNEEVGAFAAGADALLTGQIAACAGSCGPGNLHLIQGLYNSHRNRAPVFAIAGQVPTRFLGTEYFQETHPERIFRDCSHYCEAAYTAVQAATMSRLAIQSAITKRGVGPGLHSRGHDGATRRRRFAGASIFHRSPAHSSHG